MSIPAIKIRLAPGVLRLNGTCEITVPSDQRLRIIGAGISTSENAGDRKLAHHWTEEEVGAAVTKTARPCGGFFFASGRAAQPKEMVA